MIDNSDKFRNFKESIPKNSGSLPIMPYVNVKTVLLQWLEYRFKSLNLTNPIILLGEYPSQTNISDIPVGNDGVTETNNLRGVSVVLLDGSTKRHGIGQVIDTEQVDNDASEDSTLKYGWHERLQLEITYWSVSSRDRDYGGDLIRAFILEAFRIGWLLENGLVEMYLHNYYDTSDTRLARLSKPISYSVSTFEFTRVFYGTLDYSQFNDRPSVEDVTIENEISEFPEYGGSYGPSVGSEFLPAPDSGTRANFDRLSEGVVILPGGETKTIMDLSARSSSMTTICKEKIL